MQKTPKDKKVLFFSHKKDFNKEMHADLETISGQKLQ